MTRPSRFVTNCSRSPRLVRAVKSYRVVLVEKPCSAYEWPLSKTVAAARRPSGDTRTRLGSPLSGNRSSEWNCVSNNWAHHFVADESVVDVRQIPISPPKYTRRHERFVTYEPALGFCSAAISTL